MSQTFICTLYFTHATSWYCHPLPLLTHLPVTLYIHHSLCHAIVSHVTARSLSPYHIKFFTEFSVYFILLIPISFYRLLKKGSTSPRTNIYLQVHPTASISSSMLVYCLWWKLTSDTCRFWQYITIWEGIPSPIPSCNACNTSHVMGIIRIKRACHKILSIEEHTYTTLPRTALCKF